MDNKNAYRAASGTVIVIILIAIILGVGVYLWQKSIATSEKEEAPQEIADVEIKADQAPEKKTDEEKPSEEKDGWTTFKEGGGGFRFEYPSNWEYEETEAGVKKTVSFKDPGNDYYIVFSFSTMPNQGGMTAEQWWEEAGKTSPYKQVSTVKIAGFQALKLEAQETEAGPRFVFVTASQGGVIVDISTTGLSEKVLNKILDSFELSKLID